MNYEQPWKASLLRMPESDHDQRQARALPFLTVTAVPAALAAVPNETECGSFPVSHKVPVPGGEPATILLFFYSRPSRPAHSHPAAAPDFTENHSAAFASSPALQ